MRIALTPIETRMRAAFIGLAVLATACLPAAAAFDPTFDDRPSGGCPSVRAVEESIFHDIETTHGAVMALKPAIGRVYLDAAGLTPPADGYGAVLIYMREDLTQVGFVTADMERACEGTSIPTALHIKAMKAATTGR